MCLFETGWWNWRVDVESCGFGVLVHAYATRNWMRMEREPVLPIFVKLHNPTQLCDFSMVLCQQYYLNMYIYLVTKELPHIQIYLRTRTRGLGTV